MAEHARVSADDRQYELYVEMSKTPTRKGMGARHRTSWDTPGAREKRAVPVAVRNPDNSYDAYPCEYHEHHWFKAATQLTLVCVLRRPELQSDGRRLGNYFIRFPSGNSRSVQRHEIVLDETVFE